MLAILTDAFGGHGGIAKFNRDLLTALDAYPECSRIVALLRHMPLPSQNLPEKLLLDRKSVGSKLRFLVRCVYWLCRGGRFDLVICGHINLLPFAWLFRIRRARPIVLVTHGVDAWTPTAKYLTDRLARRSDAYIAVSSFTRDRFIAWSNAPSQDFFVLPNCVDPTRFSPGPEDPTLVEQYDLSRKKVLLTLGRLDPRQQAKGFDEVIEALPELLAEDPDIVYLIAGDGDDRARLERKARVLGVAEKVVFTGYIDEASKPDYFRLADLYVMPSRGEGFGIVYLEALACGIPVVGGAFDGSREALLDGRLGTLVDPDDRDALIAAIRGGLKKPKGIVDPQLENFSEQMFRGRVAAIIDAIRRRRQASDRTKED